MSNRKTKADKPSLGRRVALIGGGVLVLGAIVWMAWSLAKPEPPPPPELAAVETFPDLGVLHNDDPSVAIEYNSDPPTSGPHSSVPASCGIYREPVADGNQLHSMEHGAIVVQYTPGLDSAEVEVLEDTARSLRRDIIVAPREGLSAPIVMTAWTKMLVQDTASEEVLRGFYQEYVNLSPEGGAICAFEIDQSR